MTDTWDTIKVEPERDRYGRYVIHPAKGGKPKSYTRATTVAETLDDRYNLEAWKVRTTALGIVQRPDLYAAIASTPADEKQRLNKLCDQAREAAAGSAGANLGTALHRFTERLNRGEDVVVPAPWDADIAAYMSALDASEYTIVPAYLEGTVVLEKLGVAGMFDMILRHRTIGNRIADLKTGATLDFSWGAIAVQLALYAHADTLYDHQSKTHELMPAVDQEKAIVIHLPAGKATCTLYEIDIAAGWEAAQHALWAREWRRNKRLATPLTIVSGGTGSAIEAAPSTDTIVGGGETQVPVKAAVEPAPPADVFEGGDADPVAVTELRERFNALTPEATEWMKGIIFVAKAHGRKLGLQSDPTQRKYWIGLGLISLAEHGADTQLLAAAMEVAADGPVPPTGEHLSLFSCERAARFAFAAEQLAKGGALIFDDNGIAHVTAA